MSQIKLELPLIEVNQHNILSGIQLNINEDQNEIDLNNYLIPGITVNKGTILYNDYHSLETELLSKLISGKVLIDMKNTPSIEFKDCSSPLRDHAILRLKQKIK